MTEPKIIYWDNDDVKKTVHITVSGGTDYDAAAMIAERLYLGILTIGAHSGIVALPGGMSCTILFDRIEDIKPPDVKLKALSDYTDAEKIAWFDETYNDSVEYLEFLEKNRYEMKDCYHYMGARCLGLLGNGGNVRWNAVDQIY